MSDDVRPIQRRHSRMKILGIVWVGVRTRLFESMLGLFRDVMGLDVVHAEDQFAVLQTANGDTVELFGEKSKYNPHFSSSSVVGFLVESIESARDELVKNRTELIGDIEHGEDGYAWQHFVGPDGNIYEIVYDPSRLTSVKRNM